MRVYNREDFLELPPGTVYVKDDTLYIKEESWKNDWDYQDFCSLSTDTYCLPKEYSASCQYDDGLKEIKMQDEMLLKGTSYPIDLDITDRDGLFEMDDIFLVYEKEDVKALIKRLQVTLE